MYRHMKWAICYDGETPAVRKLGVFVLNHWARKQVCYKQLNEKQTCKGVFVECGFFLRSFWEPLRPTSVGHCWGFCKRTLRGQETPRGHCMNLWKWSLGCSGDAKRWLWQTSETKRDSRVRTFSPWLMLLLGEGGDGNFKKWSRTAGSMSLGMGFASSLPPLTYSLFSLLPVCGWNVICQLPALVTKPSLSLWTQSGTISQNKLFLPCLVFFFLFLVMYLFHSNHNKQIITNINHKR